MKIGLVLDDSLDTADGVQQYVLLLGDWLGRHGHEAHYLTVGSRRQDIHNLHSVGRQLRVKFNRNTVPLALPTSPGRIADLLQRENFDVLHVQMPYSPYFGARVVSLAPEQTALVGTFHIMPYAKTERALNKLLGYWLKPTLARFDSVMSVSRPAQKFASEVFKLDSELVTNMVDTSSYRSGYRFSLHQPLRLIFVGRLVPRKGCAHLLKALAYLTVPYKATIVGEGPQRHELEKLAAKLGIKSKVTFTGLVSEDKKRSLLAVNDIAVYPATGGESFGIVLIEAMATSSLLVLAGNNEGYNSVMGSARGSLFDPHDHQALAEKIDRLATDQLKAKQLYAAQQKLVSQYDVNQVGPKILAQYQAAIANRQKRLHTKH